MAQKIIDLAAPTLPLVGTELMEMSEGGTLSVQVAVNEALTKLYYNTVEKAAATVTGISVAEYVDSNTGVLRTSGDLSIEGDLFVDGTTWVVHNQEVTTSDNLIVINYGETGPGVTAGWAGIEVDRGTLTNYQFLFYEDTDTFRIGEMGSTQAVATREDNPIDGGYAIWNDSLKRFDTTTSISGSVDHNSTTGLQGGDSTAGEFYHLTQDIHDGLYSGSPIIGLGAVAGTNLEVDYGNDTITIDIDGSNIVSILNPPTSYDYNMVITNAVHSGGGLKINLDDHLSSEDYYGFELSMISTDVSGGSAYTYVEGIDIFVKLDSPDATGADQPDVVGGWIAARSNGTGHYGIIDGLDVDARHAVGATLEYLSGLSSYTDNRGTINEDMVGLSSTNQFWSGSAKNVYGIWDLVQTWSGATIDDVYLIWAQYRDNGTTINNDVWGIYVEDSDAVGIKNHIEGSLELGLGTSITEFSIDGTLGGDSDDAVPTEKAVKTYVDNAIGSLEAGNESLSNGDTTAEIIFSQAQSDTNYSQFWSIENSVDSPPSIFTGVVYDKTVNGFKVLFSGTIDSNNYVLSWGII